MTARAHNLLNLNLEYVENETKKTPPKGKSVLLLGEDYLFTGYIHTWAGEKLNLMSWEKT